MTHTSLSSIRDRIMVLLAFGLIAWASTSAAQSRTTVVHAGRMIDVLHKDVRTRVSILIQQDRITAVQDGFVSPEGAQIIDLSKETVLPGLIDCHKHLTMHIPGPNAYQELVTQSPVDDAFYAVVNARMALLNGFTSIRNVGARGNVDISLRKAIERGMAVGPRMWVSGAIIGPTGGHSDPSDGLAPGIIHPDWKSSIGDSPLAIRRIVREHRKYGDNLIKIVPSGGVGSIGDDPKLQLMNDDEMKSAIDTAHALGMKVAAHAHGKLAIDNSVRLGVDSIDHGTYADAESFRLMKEHGTYLVPTVYIARVLFETAREHPDRLPPNVIAKIQAIAPVIASMFTNAYHAGVKIAFGTDTMGNFRTGTPAKELTEMVRLGMSPMDALVSATQSGADLIGGSEDIGSLQPGRFADIIAVQGDPLEDITRMEHVQFVMKGGVIYKMNGAPAPGALDTKY